MKQLILVLTLALGVSGCVRAPISKVPTAPTVGFGGADAGFGGTAQPANKLGARMMLSYPACTPVGGVQCTSPYGLYLPPHGYPNWDGPLNYNAQTINDAIAAAAAGGKPASPAFAVQFANTSAASFQADANITINPTTHALTTSILISSSSPVFDVRAYGAKVDGSTNDYAAIAAAIAAASGAGGGVAYIPAGKAISASVFTMPANVYLRGAGKYETTLQFTGTNLDSGLDYESINGGEVSDLSIIGSTGTLTRAIKVNNSQNISLHDLIVQGGGSGNNGVSPRDQIQIQGSTGITIQRDLFTNDGGSFSLIDVDYFLPTPNVVSSRINIWDSTLFASTAVIDIEGFQCQFCDWSRNYINGGNQYGGGNNNGYGILNYSHGFAVALPTTGASINGTDTLTLTFPANILPVVPMGSYLLQISGVATCTGTQPNGTFAATALSGTTVQITSTGSTCSSASLSAATVTPSVHPEHVVISGNRIQNTAGTGIYNQSGDFTVISNNTLENIAQQQQEVSLPVGCIALNDGTGENVTGNTCNGSGEAGIDVANANNFTVGVNTITNATAQGIRLLGATGCHVVGNIVNGSNFGLFVGSGTVGCEFDNTFNGSVNTAIDAESGSTDNTFKGTINNPGTLQGTVDAGTRNHWNGITYNAAAAYFSGTHTTGDGDKFYNLPTASNAINLDRVQHANFKNMHGDTIYNLIGAVGVSNDVTCENCSTLNESGSGFFDNAAAVVTGTVASTSCTITGLSVTTMPVGSIISDFSTDGYIPPGSTIVSVNAGASSLVFANAASACATGNGTESINYYATYVNGLNLINPNWSGNFPTTVQPFESEASQNIHINGGSIKGFGYGSQALLNFINTSCTLPGDCSINGGLITDSLISGAATGLGLDVTNQTSNLNVSDVSFLNTASWALQDVGTGTGNSYQNIFQNAPSSTQFNMTNTNSVWSVKSALFGSGAPGSTCVAATRGYTYWDTTNKLEYLCDGTSWSAPIGPAPLTGTTGSIGGGALLVNACATGTATVTGISSAMAISVTPVSDPNASTTQDYDWYGYMSGTNTVTVKVCALVAGTPGATNYNVRAAIQ